VLPSPWQGEGLGVRSALQFHDFPVKANGAFLSKAIAKLQLSGAAGILEEARLVNRNTQKMELSE
jgi:hypothetical protein